LAVQWLFEDPRSRVRDEPGAGHSTAAVVSRVDIDGPYRRPAPPNTAARQRLFTCRPFRRTGTMLRENAIFSAVAHRAYGVRVTGDDMSS